MKRQISVRQAKAIGRALDKLALIRGYTIRGGPHAVDLAWIKMRADEASNSLRPLLAEEVSK